MGHSRKICWPRARTGPSGNRPSKHSLLVDEFSLPPEVLGGGQGMDPTYWESKARGV